MRNELRYYEPADLKCEKPNSPEQPIYPLKLISICANLQVYLILSETMAKKW